MAENVKSDAVRPRWKDYLLALYCLSTDWMQAIECLYRSDKRGPLVWLGARAQLGWFKSHNCRFYNWLDARDEGEPSTLTALTWQMQNPVTLTFNGLPVRTQEEK